MLQEDHSRFELRAKLTFTMSHIHSISRDFTQGRRPAKSVKISKSAHPSGPWTASWRPWHLFLVIYSQPQRSRKLSAAPNQHQLSVSTTSQQHQISFQFLPPGSSTKSASSFYHQAAAPNKLPVSTARQQHQISF